MIITRRFLLITFAVLLALTFAAYWFGPASAARARLELLALDVDSRFGDQARLAAATDSAGLSVARFPLILAVRNTGVRPASPRHVALSVPGWIRLYDDDGSPLPFQDAGESLIQYRIALEGEAIEPASLPLVPAGLEHLWITAELAYVTCRLRWDGVPEFAPSPQYDPALLSTIEAFYVLESRDQRDTGQLRIILDAGLVQGEKGEFETGPVTIVNGGLRLPALNQIALEGRRNVVCGAPEQRVVFESVVWRTGANEAGRWIQIVTGGSVRRMLYDTTGDGTIDLEVWDGQADGRFEASRPVSYRVPPFLLPLRALPPADSAETAMADSAPAAVRDTSPVRDTVQAVVRDTTRAVVRDTTRPVVRDSTRAAGDTGQAVPRRPLQRDSTMLQALRQDSLRRDSLLRARVRRDTLEQVR